MNSERRLDYGKLLAIGVIALLGLTLMGGALFAPKTVSGAPRMGIQAIVTCRSCDFVQLEQQPYAVCDDGSQWRVEQLPFAESPSRWSQSATVTTTPPSAGRTVRCLLAGSASATCPAAFRGGRGSARPLPAFVAVLDKGDPGRPGMGLPGQGGRIQYVAGVPWVDFLTTAPQYTYGTLVDAMIVWP